MSVTPFNHSTIHRIYRLLCNLYNNKGYAFLLQNYEICMKYNWGGVSNVTLATLQPMMNDSTILKTVAIHLLKRLYTFNR